MATQMETTAKQSKKRKTPESSEASVKTVMKSPMTDEDATEMTDDGPGLVVAKAVRSVLKGMSPPMHCGSDAIPALNSRISELIAQAAERAHKNGRKTIKAIDF